MQPHEALTCLRERISAGQQFAAEVKTIIAMAEANAANPGALAVMIAALRAALDKHDAT